MSFLAIRNLCVSYGNTVAINQLTLLVEQGSIYSFIGPSGCGKSTLLKAICGIVRPASGEIRLKDEPTDPRRQSFGYIPQHYGLLDWLTVKNNLALGKKIRKTASDQESTILEQLEITDLLDRYPASLSGGQQQRVALARAWMLQPDLLLMDEPFSSLDMFTAEKSRELFLHLWRERRTTTLFVTHSIQEAVSVGKYIVLLSGQPAGVVEVIENPLFQQGAKRTGEAFFRFEQQVTNRIRDIRREAND